MGPAVCKFVFPALAFGEGLIALTEGAGHKTGEVAALDVGQAAFGIDRLDLEGTGDLGTGDTDAVLGEDGADGGLLGGLIEGPTLFLLWSFRTDKGVFSSASVAAGTIVVGCTLLTRARYRLL